MSVFTHPLLLLQELDQAYRKQDRPQNPPVEKSGINALGLMMQGQKLLIDSSEIRELTRFTSNMRVSRVPGTKPWFCGLSSRHGQLLPLIDLASYLLEKPTEILPTTRIITTGHGKQSVGLLINDVSSLKHFDNAQQVTDFPAFSGCISDYLAGVFQDGEQYWGLLSMRKLFQNPKFADAIGS